MCDLLSKSASELLHRPCFDVGLAARVARRRRLLCFQAACAPSRRTLPSLPALHSGSSARFPASFRNLRDDALDALLQIVMFNFEMLL